MSISAKQLYSHILTNGDFHQFNLFALNEGNIGNYPVIYDGRNILIDGQMITASVNIDNKKYSVGIGTGNIFKWISKEISETDWVKLKLASRY